MHGDTCAVRDGEQFDHAALATCLRWHLADEQLPGLRLDDEMQVSQFPGGHSNLTYLIRLGGAELVLRRPLVAPHPDQSHALAREYRWLEALHPVFDAAPRPYFLCEDTSVLGSAFFTMERRRGVVVRGEEPMPLAGHADLRTRTSESLVDLLVALHAVDITEPPLATLGSPIGCLDRVVRDWLDRWAHTRVAASPAMETVALWLEAHQPPDALDPTVVHGRCTLENVLLNPLAPSRVNALLDWETAMLGDPLLDLGILLAEWTPIETSSGTLSSLTGRSGWLTRDALIERYARQSGRDVSSVAYYEVLALFQRAVQVQQALLLYDAEHHPDRRAATLSDNVQALAARAVALTTSSPNL